VRDVPLTVLNVVSKAVRLLHRIATRAAVPLPGRQQFCRTSAPAADPAPGVARLPLGPILRLSHFTLSCQPSPP